MHTRSLRKLGITLREFDEELPRHGFRREYRPSYERGGFATRYKDSWQYTRSINTEDGFFAAWICVRLTDSGERSVINSMRATQGLRPGQEIMLEVWMQTRMQEAGQVA